MRNGAIANPFPDRLPPCATAASFAAGPESGSRAETRRTDAPGRAALFLDGNRAQWACRGLVGFAVAVAGRELLHQRQHDNGERGPADRDEAELVEQARIDLETLQ